jgi:hypothetical protein
MPMTYFSGWISIQKNFQVDLNANDLFFWVDIHLEKFSSRKFFNDLIFWEDIHPEKFQVYLTANDLFFWVDIHTEKVSSLFECQ